MQNSGASASGSGYQVAGKGSAVKHVCRQEEKGKEYSEMESLAAHRYSMEIILLRLQNYFSLQS